MINNMRVNHISSLVTWGYYMFMGFTQFHYHSSKWVPFPTRYMIHLAKSEQCKFARKGVIYGACLSVHVLFVGS